MSSTQTKTIIRLQGLAFAYPIRYQAGHTINESEAQVLNGAMADNVRNTAAPWLVDLTLGGLTNFNTRLQELAMEYKFAPRASAHRGLTPVEKLARQMALEQLLAADADAAISEQAVIDLALDFSLQLKAASALQTQAATAKEALKSFGLTEI